MSYSPLKASSSGGILGIFGGSPTSGQAPLMQQPVAPSLPGFNMSRPNFGNFGYRPGFGNVGRPSFGGGLAGLGSLLMFKIGQQKQQETRTDVDDFLGEVSNLANERFGVSLGGGVMARPMFNKTQPVAGLGGTNQTQPLADLDKAVGYSTGGQVSRREARNRVRQMGGIMASSEPLVKEVSKYQFGGNVDVLSEIRNMRPEIRSAFLRSIGNPPKKTGTRSQTIFSNIDPIYSSLINGRESNLSSIRPGDPGSPQFKGGILAGEVQNTVERQKFNKLINNANQAGLLEAPTLNKTDLENFIKNETGDDAFKLTSKLWDSLSEDKSPSMSNFGKIAKEIFKYTSTPSVAAIDLMGGAINYLRQKPAGTAEKILSGQMKLPTGVDFVSLALASGKTLPELEALGVPATQMAAIKEARDKGFGFETKVKIKDDVAEKEALEAEQIAMREAEKPKAIAGGMPLPNQVGATDVEALQDQISGGRSSIDRQTLGVTADENTEVKLDAESKKVLDGEGEGDINKVKDQISEVVKTGVGTKGALKQLMKEFTDNAPEYKGLDRGLAIAKIGFAMAAGESPNAITNIAKALSDGADMFIEDEAKRDAFNRQVQLSALQYGLGEVSKQRAQARADARTFMEFAVGDKPVTWKGTTYKPGQSIIITNKDYFDNGGKLPPGLISEKLLTANQSALNARLKANADLSKKLLEMKSMSITEQKAFVDDYAALHRKASEAETAGTLIESVIKRAPDVVGLTPALQSAGARFTALFGYDAPAGWNTRDLTVQDLTAALQSVIPATLGETQSANSISDRDVSLLIQSFISGGIITQKGDEPGIFNFATTTQEKFINSLQNGLRAVRRAQVGALTEMTAIENQMLNLLTPDQRIGSSALDPIKRTGIFAPGGTGAEGFTLGSMNLGDDGIWDITI